MTPQLDRILRHMGHICLIGMLFGIAATVIWTLRRDWELPDLTEKILLSACEIIIAMITIWTILQLYPQIGRMISQLQMLLLSGTVAATAVLAAVLVTLIVGYGLQLDAELMFTLAVVPPFIGLITIKTNYLVSGLLWAAGSGVFLGGLFFYMPTSMYQDPPWTIAVEALLLYLVGTFLTWGWYQKEKEHSTVAE